MSSSIYPTLAGSLINVERSASYDTTVQRESSGRELRLAKQSQPIYRYRIAYDFLRQDATTDEAATLYGFLMAHRGAWDSFLFLDPYDSTVTAQEFGVGDAATTGFQLQRHPGGVVSDVLGTWPVYTASRTNLVTYSQAIDNAAWTKTNATVDDEAAMAPDGSGITADKLQENTGTGLHDVTSAVAAGSGSYTFSAYLKAGERTKVVLRFDSSVALSTFDLSAGSVTVGTAAGAIVSVGNGWYRCSVTATCTGTDKPAITLVDGTGATNYTGVAGNGAYVWGAQLEAGSTATRYIATTSASVTERPSFWPGGVYEPIYAPAMASVSITNAGVASTAWTPGSSGVVNFTSAPASGNALAWSGTFYRRVRFDADSLQFERRHSRIWKASVELVSVIG